MEWELVVSLSPTVEGKGGLTSHTRSPTLAMNGRNLLLDPPIMGRSLGFGLPKSVTILVVHLLLNIKKHHKSPKKFFYAK
jgi:hypothetical protein